MAQKTKNLLKKKTFLKQERIISPISENEYEATWQFGTGATSNIGAGANTWKELRLIPDGITGG